jgi:hypothetical protein
MNEPILDHTAPLKNALRANLALIYEAQLEITCYHTKKVEAQELINRLIRIFDGPGQRHAQQLANDALAEGSDHFHRDEPRSIN